MYRPLAEQWEQVQAELSHKLAEAEKIGISLVELGLRLKEEPWRWTLGWMENALPGGDTPHPVEPELEEALDKHRLMWLLDDIRILRRREAELRRLAASSEQAAAAKA